MPHPVDPKLMPQSMVLLYHQIILLNFIFISINFKSDKAFKRANALNCLIYKPASITTSCFLLKCYSQLINQLIQLSLKVTLWLID